MKTITVIISYLIPSLVILVSGDDFGKNVNTPTQKIQAVENQDPIPQSTIKEEKDSLWFYILSEEGEILQTIFLNQLGVYSKDREGNFRVVNGLEELDEDTYQKLYDSIGKINHSPFIEAITKGDFNGDGKIELAWLEHGAIRNDTFGYWDKTDEQIIRFSDKTIRSIHQDHMLMAYGLASLGDLNNDGSGEIGISISPYPGNTQSFVVYTFINKEWEVLEAVDNTLNMREAGIKFIERDTIKAGYCKVRVPLLFYRDTANKIPEKYIYDVNAKRYLLSPTFSHVVEISVKFD